ncbi:MAG: bifunctional (p)ppGpp synthetase/guanosine-3',5'-bis(diphosphate) 3'-pyrophosphohydrolase [Rhodospirillaceae bacterium]|nr:MAG: bifunctional (p)ppGpp synthetase/guanosine-3',5'-bis(diphosphate) 3'-pyrophosphohydrolase [Rhodospirillaceae bacterium]
MIRQFELVDAVKAYDSSVDEEMLNRAYVFSMKAHGSQKRASGDPYFSHPLEVAGILTGLKLGGLSIATALLHDTVEDTLTTLDEIERQFGSEIAALVNGVTKLSRIELQSDRTQQAENFRKLVLAMSDDIRVLLVKLADRLHNMRTLHYIQDPEKRRRIARETMDIYAPLADRIGLHVMKDELQDLAFAELNPDALNSILARLSYLRQEGGVKIPKILQELEAAFRDGGVSVTLSGREKKPSSIWKKMEHKHISFEQLSDVMAFRVVVANPEDCYRALGVLHQRYRVVPGRFKDYISTPKPNGYRSLHTGIIGPERQWVEVQIRTHEMQDVAEHGVAAHWQYKGGLANGTDGRQYRWLRELLELLENASGPEEFLEETKLGMFQDQVFCFTPRGDLIVLPHGATPVDFAYAVHSEVGNTCVGAKVNGRMLPLRSQLHNGDQVEIITSKAQTPSPTWEAFAVTSKARMCIRRFVRSKQRGQYMQLGKAIFERKLQKEGVDLSGKRLEDICKSFHCDSADDLYAALGEARYTVEEIFKTAFPGKAFRSRAGNVIAISWRKRKKKSGKTPIPIRGLIPGMAVHYAACCSPLPGDRIVGIVTKGKGVMIHTIDCEVLSSFDELADHWLDVAWDVGAEAAATAAHAGRVQMVVLNEPGTLSSLSTVIANNGGNINNLKITDRSADFFELVINIEVENAKHLTGIIAALRASPVINTVERARG